MKLLLYVQKAHLGAHKQIKIERTAGVIDLIEPPRPHEGPSQLICLTKRFDRAQVEIPNCIIKKW